MTDIWPIEEERVGKTMLIAVVSDIHRHTEWIDKAAPLLKTASVLFCLGDHASHANELMRVCDRPVLSVRGNCDWGEDAPWQISMVFSGKRIFATHGHHYGVKLSLDRLRDKAEKEKADIVLFGHTHVPAVTWLDGRWFINPGSLGEPRSSAGRTFARVEIEEGEAGKIVPSIVRVPL